jgi:serine protease AprX
VPMRRIRWLVRLASPAAVFCALLLLPGYAHAGADPKIDQRLAAEIARADPNSDVHVIVVGSGASKAKDRIPGTKKRDLDLIGGASLTLKARDVARLKDEAGVTAVLPDPQVVTTATAFSTASLATLFPAVDGAGTAWTSGYDGTGVGILVIDSGVAASSDFGTRLRQLSDSADDVYGHGSLVAGVAAGASVDGRFAGIAPGANVLSWGLGSPDGIYSSDVISALNWVVNKGRANGIRVVNLSLQELTPSSYLQDAMDTAVEQVWKAGFVVVASSGNNGPGSAYYAPGNDPFTITVGSVDNKDTLDRRDDVVADFSTSGVTLDGYVKPELLAPGRHIGSLLPAGTPLAAEAPAANWLDPTHATISGTSFSAPQVAGAAALLLQKNPSLTPNDVKGLLLQTARSTRNANGDYVPGAVLNVAAAAGFAGVVDPANVGVPQATYGLASNGRVKYTDSGASTTPSTSSWNGTALNSGNWNTSSWNTASWNTSSWNTASWNTSSWNTSSWNTGGWN